jgi:two-component system phosphate regulon sensor histidine kinase PhoR
MLARGSASDGSELDVLPSLPLHVAIRDHHVLEQAAQRRGRQILAATIACVLFSLGLAAFLFLRAQRAQRLAELRTDFVAAVSHELRTPIASVRMLSELLEGGQVAVEEREEIETTLAGEVRRLASTLERMLRFGALSRGKLVIAPKRTRVQPFLDEGKTRFRAAHPDRDVVVTADERLEADLDEGLMALALDNLLSNAAKYAPEGGPYRLEANEDGRHVVLAVIDSGPGLDRRAQARIFQPFERADDRLSKATEGTGVGLALVRGIARAHRGDATVESTPGRGATFRIRIPKTHQGRKT